MKFGIVIFPGSNCDYDAYKVIQDVTGQKVQYLWHQDRHLSNCDCVILPGGFSYGDYLRTGAVARFSPIMKKIIEFARKGGLVLGICNGYQILLEAGLLPGAILRNKTLRFICKNVYLKVDNQDTPFTNLCSAGRILKVPIAHKDGDYYADSKTLRELKTNNQIVFKYCDKNGNLTEASNPNGSLEHIAGITNRNKNVLGLMPHPERGSEKILGSDDGKVIFQSIVNFFEN